MSGIFQKKKKSVWMEQKERGRIDEISKKHIDRRGLVGQLKENKNDLLYSKKGGIKALEK